MVVDLTVAICGHNAERRLPSCLDAISLQRFERETTWDVLVVDNASTDATASIASSYRSRIEQAGGHLTIVREDRKGLIFARERAAQDAHGELIAFVDDDNLIAPDFVEQAVAFFRRRHRCGLAGGRIEPAFEDESTRPPDFNDRFADALACRDHGDTERQLIPPTDDPPPGAGLVGRARVFRTALLEVGCVLTGRSGKRLTSGEDTEIGLIAHRLGWELWHTPALKLRHVMPPGRLTQAYLDRIIAGGSRAEAWLDLLRGKTPIRSRPAWATVAARHEIASARFALLAALRKNHPHALRYLFWRNLYHGRATGYWQLALHNPWEKLQQKLRGVRPATPRPHSPSLDLPSGILSK
jgi:GT2 family glycosyltransferase